MKKRKTGEKENRQTLSANTVLQTQETPLGLQEDRKEKLGPGKEKGQVDDVSDQPLEDDHVHQDVVEVRKQPGMEISVQIMCKQKQRIVHISSIQLPI